MYLAGSVGLILAYVPLNLIMMKAGVKWGLFVGFLICSIGLYLETLLEVSADLLSLGYLLCRFGALSSTLAYGEAVSLWFPRNQTTLALLMVQASLYLGYGLGHDILKEFVDNQSDLSISLIRSGVQGYLWFNIAGVGVALLLILFVLKNRPDR